jgi:hypothetical protein
MSAQAHARLKRLQFLLRVTSRQASPACEIEQIADSVLKVCLVQVSCMA